MKRIYLILILIQLFFCSTNIQGQNDTLVLININNIRIANVKLNERLHLIEINKIQDSIIDNYKVLIDKYETDVHSFTGKLTEANTKLVKLNNIIAEEEKEKNKWKTIGIGGITVSCTLILIFLIK